MQLTGWHNGNEMRNAIRMAHKLQLSGSTVYSLYCGLTTFRTVLLRILTFMCGKGG